MKNKTRRIYILSLLLPLSVYGQTEWPVPEDAAEKLCIKRFEEDMQQEGKQLYTTSCASCHGTPSQGNFTMMVPSPGDVSSSRFGAQKDGELFYKIQKGRGSMPAFENTFSENEIWNLIAYIRSFHREYTQELPNLEGLEIPELNLTLGYDENIDKLVVMVADGTNGMLQGVNVKAYVKGMFGNHLLGKAVTNELGIAWVDIDAGLPGDQQGYITVLVKAEKGYGSARLEQRVQAASPTIRTSVIEGRHLWSRAKLAPIWMIVIFNLIGIGVWATIIYILIGLRKIKKLQ